MTSEACIVMSYNVFAGMGVKSDPNVCLNLLGKTGSCFTYNPMTARPHWAVYSKACLISVKWSGCLPVEHCNDFVEHQLQFLQRQMWWFALASMAYICSPEHVICIKAHFNAYFSMMWVCVLYQFWTHLTCSHHPSILIILFILNSL